MAAGTSREPLSKERVLAEALPHLAAMVAAELHDHDDDPLGWCDSQAEFEFTLDRPAGRLGTRAPGARRGLTRVLGSGPDCSAS